MEIVTCATCGTVAAELRATPPGATADLGPPLGLRRGPAPGVRVTGFGEPLWTVLGEAEYAAVRRGDYGAAVRRLPFFCAECAHSYCRAHWNVRRVSDTLRGTCPLGHPRAMPP
ncbi:hypothetical protein [Actinomadura flavalba]|uniref:hypothetical protein n=1 Tax=Actinomadura flavalba TaxID=1120938 RepID=UPI00035CA5C4|nr:hypothetical protein [Actinomadura flavalba]